MTLIDILLWPLTPDGTAWIGSALLAFCALPQAYKTYIEGHSRGISAGMLWMWGVGELLLLKVTVIDLNTMDEVNNWSLAFNYAVNALLIGYIVYKRIYPSDEINRSESRCNTTHSQTES